MKKISPMTLGTVQLGLNYGIANRDGQPDREKSFSILRSALEGGARSLDTARAYGTSEEVIGAFLKEWEGPLPYITTKIPRLGDPYGDIEKHILTSIEESLSRLGIPKADCVLLHNAEDLFAHKEKTASAMQRLVTLGFADQIGSSVYTREDIEEMLHYPQYTATQIPMSIFDQRLIASGTLAKLKEREYTTFVRSVFLQGLFFLDPDTMEDPILTEHAAPKIRLLRQIAQSEGRTVAELAIAFILDCGGVTSLVLGADSPAQVVENLSYFDTPALSESVLQQLQDAFSAVDIPEIMKVLSRPKG